VERAITLEIGHVDRVSNLRALAASALTLLIESLAKG